MTDVSVLIPWRDSGDTNRQINLVKTVDWLEDLGYPIYLCPDGKTEGPFNRSAAYNYGLRNFPADVYVFHEADMLIELSQIQQAISAADAGIGLVIPFRRYRYLNEDASRIVINGFPPKDAYHEWVMDHGRAVGAVGVASHESMKWVGGWDESLMGHGYDDRCMVVAFETACGSVRYVDGDGVHLWHPMAYAPWEKNTWSANAENFDPAEVAATRYNQNRLTEYLAAKTPEDIRELTGGQW